MMSFCIKHAFSWVRFLKGTEKCEVQKKCKSVKKKNVKKPPGASIIFVSKDNHY